MDKPRKVPVRVQTSTGAMYDAGRMYGLKDGPAPMGISAGHSRAVRVMDADSGWEVFVKGSQGRKRHTKWV